MNAVFELDGDGFLPTDAARGPWDPRFLHGGPVAMLVGREIERVPSEAPMRVARLTLELVRPVPVAKLEVKADVTRPGCKIRLLDALVTAAGVEVVRAVVLQIRRGALELDAPREPPSPSPEGLEPWQSWEGRGVLYHTAAVELRSQPGAAKRAPGAVWVRLRLPPFAGEEPVVGDGETRSICRKIESSQCGGKWQSYSNDKASQKHP